MSVTTVGPEAASEELPAASDASEHVDCACADTVSAITPREWFDWHGRRVLACTIAAVIVGIAVLWLGAGSPIRETSAPGERIDQFDALLTAARESKDAADALVGQQQDKLEALRRENPNLNLETARAMLTDRLRTLGEQLTAAQVVTLQAERTYGTKHEARQRALDCETQISSALTDAQQQATALNATAETYAAAERELGVRQSEADHSAARLRRIEERRDGDITPVMTVATPVRLATTSGLLFVSFAAVAGLAIGLAWSLVRDRFDDRFRTTGEVRDKLGTVVLGVVPAIPARRTEVSRAMISHLDPRGSVAEAFRSLRTRLLLGARHSNQSLHTILVTSPESGDGRSLCAVNLAVALAQAGRSVLLVDGNVRRPSLNALLDLRDGNGLLEVLESPKLFRWSIQPSGIDGLDVLPSGDAATNAAPGELIDRFRLKAILAAPTGHYDHIIFDSPAVNPVADALALAAECDATVLVVRADETTDRSADVTMAALAGVGARVVGVVINAAPYGPRYGITAHIATTTRPSPTESAPASNIHSEAAPAYEPVTN